MNKISDTFKHLKKAGGKAFIPYIMAGDPSLDATKGLVADLESAGADIIELGVPFSDPLADGPTIQRASERALAQGVTLRKVLALVEEIRKASQIPLILMTYYNPVFKYGIEAFAKEAARVGVDGVIIPDLIPDEAEDFLSCARQYNLDTIFLLAPTSTEDRIRKVVKASRGFIYYVSITGITGAKLAIGDPMKDTLDLIKNSTQKPVAIGFGISNPEEAAEAADLADGIIVGSAIVRLIAESRDIKDFARSLKPLTPNP
ncbi:MAG: tryptophan synthase subunit alpha [Nitrospiraceae bacterium]|nr:MAG: tryptophan synthase subunit alpha [Nitrospiraceae bacterium]